jgi:DNA polymerase III epsilon subunit-like protein
LITQPEEIRQLERQSQRQLPKYWQDPQQVINESLQTVVVRQKLKHSFQQQQQQDPERVRELTSIQENDLERTQLQGIQTPYVLVPEPIRSGRVVVFDVETTGFSITDSIVELGAVELIDCVRTGLLFQSYAQPRCGLLRIVFFSQSHTSLKRTLTSLQLNFTLILNVNSEIDPRAEAVHGLTKSKLRHAPPIQVYFSIHSFVLVLFVCLFVCLFSSDFASSCFVECVSEH